MNRIELASITACWATALILVVAAVGMRVFIPMSPFDPLRQQTMEMLLAAVVCLLTSGMICAVVSIIRK